MSERSEQEQVRFNKLNTLRESGFSFPNDCKPTAKASALLEEEVSEDTGSAERFTIAGRMVQQRVMGKASFAHLLDSSGKIQVYVARDDVGQESYGLFKKFDIGDIVEVSGFLFVTKKGEKTLHAESVRLLVKGLIPLPEKWHGLSDVEARYRYRYVDLIANPDVRETFKMRSKIIAGIRSFLDDRDYLEVETPTLSYVAGGASARPFGTHYNALHCDMNLRIALELPLKKLVVGGLERVYEIGKAFRNEGLSKKHNPEFTMIEFYQAYATFEDLMDLTEELFVKLAEDVLGTTSLDYCGQSIDLARPWKRISMKDSVYEIGGVEKDFDLDTLEGVVAAAQKYSVELEEPGDWGKSLEALWDTLVEDKLVNPTFITHHPFSISPLARKSEENPAITDRFELIISGMEMANAFSELNDAVDQRERFEAQAERKAQGDEEAPPADEDFLRALEYGMPPTAGQGIGIDRLVMLFTGSASIRDVLLFPQLKPEGFTEGAVTDAAANEA
jgi:lysyl-tRNA synthetase class 2